MLRNVASRVTCVRVAATCLRNMQEYLTRDGGTAGAGVGAGGPGQKEYLTRRAYPSIFIRRRLHSYISRNVTITNARHTVSGDVLLFLGEPPFALRHWLYPIYSRHGGEKQNTGEYVSRICVSRVLAGFILPGTFRCQRGVIAHRRAVKRFGRAPINHESAIYRKRE